MRLRTGYSFKHAVGHLDEVLDRLQEIGWKVAPISDRESTFAFAKWSKLAQERGMRPVYGCELPVANGDMRKIGRSEKPVYDHWCFFATDKIASLNEAVFKLTSGEVGYEAIQLPGLIKIAGKTTQINKLEPHKDFFIPLSPSTPRQLVRTAIERGFDLIACCDNVYPRAHDLDFYRIALPRVCSTQTYPQHILSRDEWRKSLSWLDDATCDAAIDNFYLALDRCKATLIKGEIYKPQRKATLRAMCEEGARKLGVGLDGEYAVRLNHELDVIMQKDFEDYFYILADVMQWARRRMVVGPARGSSCGSLVCYLLGITSVDPLKYDLVFERFIDITRADLPDVDVDLSDANRHYVFKYMDRVYGEENNARLGSVNFHKARSAMNLVGDALQVPKFQCNELINVMSKHAAGDERAGSLIKDVLERTEAGRDLLAEFPGFEIATRIESHPFVAGQHAAGIILTKDAIHNYVGVDARTGATMCDKRDAEAFNLLKIDVLGLTQLSIFERALELIGVSKDQSAWLDKLPLDDQKAFDVLNDGKFSGVFQFAPRTALATLVAEMVKKHKGKLNNIEDLVALTSLVRPGPLTAGAAHEWIRRRCCGTETKALHSEKFLRGIYNA